MGLSVQGEPVGYVISRPPSILKYLQGSLTFSFLLYRFKATRVADYCISGLKGITEISLTKRIEVEMWLYITVSCTFKIFLTLSRSPLAEIQDVDVFLCSQ